MSEATVRITIDENGIIESSAEGIFGARCKDVKRIIDSLGSVVDSKLTTDAHRSDQAVEVVPAFTRR